jgi:2-polyprenyl-6-methoxyphenol hydroxylase-like FAD-dependent oxidoreductase
MLLARKGYRALLVDKASFPSDTISTHVIWPHGADVLDRWGLLDALAATGCPPIALNMVFDVGPFALKGGVQDTNKGRGGFCPRRTVLDKILVDAAVESGAELRENFTVESLVTEGGKVVGIKGHGRNGGTVEERARVVVGADGRHSFVAKAVGAPEYEAAPALVTAYYSYFSGIDIRDVEQYILDESGCAFFPTHGGLTCVVTGWKSSHFQEVRADIEGSVKKVHATRPVLLERLDGARREEQWYGTAGVPNFFRKPYGDGWALVGDAGYDRDFLTAQGISDAFIDAENLVEAIDAGSCGREEPLDALAAYELRRNERVTPMYHFTLEIASLEPPPPEMQQLFQALKGSQEATDQFFAALTGSLPIPQFMDPENIGRIMGAADLAPAGGH